ncbi:MAG: hypothetical protein RLO21_15760, partial [Nitratireductor sp.]
MSIFDDELEGATVLSIGHRPGLEAFHTRTLHLVRTPAGAMLQHNRQQEEEESEQWRSAIMQELPSSLFPHPKPAGG